MTSPDRSREAHPPSGGAAPWLLYGAYGYTGRLIARRALERGHAPILAGRDADATRALAEELGLEARVFSLDDSDAVDRGLAGMAAVLNAAGPFSATWRPVVDGCLRAGAHYLDVTGEIAVLEAIRGREDAARAEGLHLIPGVGFDVVPTDCAAAQAAAGCPGATRLDLAFSASGGPSRGTARTALEGMGRPGAVRRGGQIVSVPAGSIRRDIPFSDRTRTGVAIPWGDVSTAWYTTGIPDIRVFVPLSPRAARLAGLVAPLLRLGPVQALARRVVDALVSGPDEEELQEGAARVWAEATDGRGHAATVELVTPNGYALTADAAVRALERVLAADLEEGPGVHTPARAFGAGFVYTLDGVRPIRPFAGR